MKFNEIVKNEKVNKAIDDMGFTSMSPIQEKIIPLILDGHDAIGHAKTGTGKTAAFVVPALEKVDFSQSKIAMLILVPTRELAKQVKEEAGRLSKYMSKLNIVEVYGGQSYDIQKRALQKRANIVVATPGRLIDLINKRFIDLSDVKYLVLDEADEMLSVGFQKELDEIITYLPKERQTLLFSATFNKRVNSLTGKYLNNPQKVSVVNKDKIASTIQQYYILVNHKEMDTALLRLLMVNADKKTVVFANTKKQVDQLTSLLLENGIPAGAIHGDITQKMRENVIAKFKKDDASVLVGSDVAARGLDIKGVELVINVDLPFEDEFYVHRVGRTGRANTTGESYILVGKRHEAKVNRLAKKFSTEMKKVKPISYQDIEKLLLEKQLNKIEEAINDKAEPENDIMDKIKPLLKKGYSLDDIFYGLANMVFETKQPKAKAVNMEKCRMFINLGKKDRISKAELVNILGLKNAQVHDIDMKPNFSFFTITDTDPNSLIQKMNNVKYKKRNVSIEIAN